MKYLAFGGNHHEPEGGWDDLMVTFDSEHDSVQSAIQQACEIALKDSYDWLHVVDLDARKIVFQAG